MRSQPDENTWYQFLGLMRDYDDGNAKVVNIEKFIGRIEREMNKYKLI